MDPEAIGLTAGWGRTAPGAAGKGCPQVLVAVRAMLRAPRPPGWEPLTCGG